MDDLSRALTLLISTPLIPVSLLGLVWGIIATVPLIAAMYIMITRR